MQAVQLVAILLFTTIVSLEASLPITSLAAGTSLSGSLAATTADQALASLNYYSIDVPLETKAVTVAVTSKYDRSVRL